MRPNRLHKDIWSKYFKYDFYIVTTITNIVTTITNIVSIVILFSITTIIIVIHGVLLKRTVGTKGCAKGGVGLASGRIAYSAHTKLWRSPSPASRQADNPALQPCIPLQHPLNLKPLFQIRWSQLLSRAKPQSLEALKQAAHQAQHASPSTPMAPPAIQDMQ